MSNILQTLLTTYQQNPAAALSLLPDLFQAVEDGRVIELPCKVGDTVYNIASKLENGSSRMISYPSVVRKITFTESGAVYFYAGAWPFSLEDINKNVYLSSTAAAKALKEHEKNGRN